MKPPTDHDLELHYSCDPDKSTVYWGTCSCSWRTAFTSTDSSAVKELMKGHAYRVQMERDGEQAVPANANGNYL